MKTSSFFHAPAIAIGLTLSVGCAALLGPSIDVSVIVVDPELQYDSSERTVALTLPYAVRNYGNTSVSYESCVRKFERLIEGEWVPVWGPLSDLIDHPLDILPGTEITVLRQFSQKLGVEYAERWTEPVKGFYRVVVGLYDGDNSTILPSPQFELTP